MKSAHPIPESRRMAGRIFLGLCLAAAGATLLLNNLGRLPEGYDWRLWPLFLSFLAGARMVERGALRTGPHFLMMVSLVLLAASFEREDLVERWWPLAIVWAGLLITARAALRKPQPAPPPSTCDDPSVRQP